MGLRSGPTDTFWDGMFGRDGGDTGLTGSDARDDGSDATFRTCFFCLPVNLSAGDLLVVASYLFMVDTGVVGADARS